MQYTLFDQPIEHELTDIHTLFSVLDFHCCLVVNMAV